MKNAIIATLSLFATLVGTTVASTPAVSDVMAKQRRPWNGLVDITCKVTGIEGKSWFAVEAVTPGTNEVREMSHVWMLRDGTKSADLAVRTNGDYHIIWDARADLGKVRCTNMVVWVNIIKHKKVQLWEGGPYWAETNIGADEPWEYGYYFWWGDTVGYTNTGSGWISVKDGSSLSFSTSGTAASTHGKDISALLSAGYIDSTGTLVAAHDAAHVQWGGGWRMPTNQELDDLCYNKCDWTWTTMNGVSGYEVRGRDDYASNSIFLPCTGRGDGKSLGYSGSNGYYWSSVPASDDTNAYVLRFYSGTNYTSSGYGRRYGRSVRPVQGFCE